MTTIDQQDVSTETPTAPTPAAPESRPDTGWTASSVIRRVGGIGMLAFPVLLAGGMVTSPPQDSDSTADYVRSLAADPTQTALSAGLFHYSWVAVALGFVAAATLVRGRRGRIATVVGSLVGGFGAVQMSGLLLLDHYEGAMGRIVGTDAAVRVTDDVWADIWTTVWLNSGQYALAVGIIAFVVGMVRARQMPWFVALTPLFVAAPFFLPDAAGMIGVLGLVPFVWVGVKLVRDGRRVA